MTNVQIKIDQFQQEHRTDDQNKAKDELDNMTTEQLDELSKQFKPKSPYDTAWEAEFVRRCLSMAEMFEDGDEVIIKAKLQDQLPRMFEKMRDNVLDRGEQMARTRQTLVRQNLEIEITRSKLEDHDKQADKLRLQYASLNHAYKTLIKHFRHRIAGSTGLNFGKYTQLHEFAKVKRMQNRQAKLTIDTLVANRKDFEALAKDVEDMKPKKTKHILNVPVHGLDENSKPYIDYMEDISNQDGIIEMPEHLE